MKIVADSAIPFIKDYFGGYGDLVLKPGRTISHQDVKDADMLIVRSITHVDQSLLEKSRIKFVGSVTAGADHLDTTFMNENDILWGVAPGFNAPPVADYVISVIAALQRKSLLQHHSLNAAVIGVGKVGQLVIDRLKWLNFNVTTCDPIRAMNEGDFLSTPLDELSGMDLISLHVPLTKHGSHPTYHFIDKHFLKRQKPGCILLNTSRGSVIDQEALLQDGSHLHWCFDVWPHEPNINHKLLADALLATPHIAGYSLQSKRRGIEMIYQLACEKKIIQPAAQSLLRLPQQTLEFAGHNHHWQDIVLGVFNPLILTAMMRTLLLPVDNHGDLFDEMRHQFQYRHEFGFTNIKDDTLADQDKLILERLGFSFIH